LARSTSLPKTVKGLAIVLAMVLGMSLPVTTAAEQAPCRRHENSERKIALTFDDGPHPTYTAEILDILEEYGIKATFFVIGSNCEAHPEVLRRAIRDGHEIGNHTYSHPHLTKIKEEKLTREVEKTESVLFELGAYRTRLFRPPEGVYSETVSKTVAAFGYIPILWTVDTEDWRLPPAKTIAETVLSHTEPGVIILCHDYVSGKSKTPDALRIFIPELLRRGYVFVTVSELLESN